ncbi:FadR/GntR family transcriptional regulator [Conexibacter woesei]|uniref:GntR domain protein n=1 Tax=Conexibacter woesei (strain DSM 14684 / CCUG 47730 / CIP 108061 / JCM 11494 / NBRC 100937 / ID131577) TaxID=469383 RepID=D3F7R0_CONWI|nr:FadR/GntR family transcriptional regulator [Conexibacter woesei]ADB50922.1 GntR domain protein [Conexibacter woesei DSM 14684]
METEPKPAGARLLGGASRAARTRLSASDELTQDLIDALKRQGFGPGDRLPSVTALATQFAVAAPTIREALRRLQALGFLDFRHGSGVYVREPLERVIVSNPYSGQLDPDVLLDLIDARLLIEPHLACLAVVRGGAEAVAELERILDLADQSLQGQDETLSDLNLDFHRAIARLSGNKVLGQTMDSLLDLYAAEQMMILQVYDNRERDAREHRAVLTAIRGGRPDLAAEQMREHLTGVRTVVEERLRAH